MSTVPAIIQAALEHEPVNPINPDATPSIVGEDDIDAIHLREAQAALQQEKAPVTPKEGPPPVADPVSPAPAAAVAEPAPVDPAKPSVEPTGKDGAAIMIPKGRLDEALQRAAYWQGVAEARAAGQPQPAAPAAPAPAPAKTPEQRLAEIDAAKLDLAGQFDDGALTARAWKEQEAALDREARALLTQPVQAPSPTGDMYLEELTAKLEDDHPYTKLIPIDDTAAWGFIETRAISSLQEKGVPLNRRPDGSLDPRSLLELRKEMAAQTDILGPAITGKTLAPAQPNGASPATPPVAPAGPSATAQARAAKLELAANHPPDVNSLGRPGNGSGDISDADITRMSDDEIASLPPTVRARFLKTG